ncbi:hypothetical protein M8818_003656 [Zalaria obscura]|uniref:Uncharacterized protein n=1 Tax=Zalaria obscura TaxID=2024903 RepID=A0ACC3SDY1_9PEZI
MDEYDQRLEDRCPGLCCATTPASDQNTPTPGREGNTSHRGNGAAISACTRPVASTGSVSQPGSATEGGLPEQEISSDSYMIPAGQNAAPGM